MSGLRRQVLDFEPFGGTNPCRLNLVDQSIYVDNPVEPRYEVICPGKTEPVTIAYVPGQVTVLNAGLLQLADPLDCTAIQQDLPDGLYKITQAVCPHDKLFTCKLHLRTTLLEECFARVLVKPQLLEHTRSADRTIIHAITDADILLQAARAETLLGNETRALEKFDRAKKVIEKIFNTIK